MNIKIHNTARINLDCTNVTDEVKIILCIRYSNVMENVSYLLVAII